MAVVVFNVRYHGAHGLSGVNIQRRLAVDSILLMMVCRGLRKSFMGFRSTSTSPLVRLLLRDGKQSQFVGVHGAEQGIRFTFTFLPSYLVLCCKPHQYHDWKS